MAEPQSYSVGLHLPGLLRILGEHLYSDPQVALREALQNAHDSCERRRVEYPEDGYEPRIRVRADPRHNLLEIEDNGSGLTHQEIREFLATIGRSYTGELRQQLELEDPEAAQSLIGQFGLGLLSGFLLADQMTLTTRSSQPGSPGLRWTSRGGQSYELEEVEDVPHGSTLALSLKPSARFLLAIERLEQVVVKYTRYLHVPISVGDQGVPLSGVVPPWSEKFHKEDYRRFVRERFGIDPLTVLPLRDHGVPLGHDQITLPLRGVLFVPPGSVTSLHEYGEVDVYIRHMLICERERDLLPPWARFVSGVVESPRLRPTVSRESLRQDEVFQQVRAGLGRQLLTHLKQLATNSPDVWREIVVGHNDLIKGWSLQEPELFEAVRDLVHFQTSRGRMTLPEIRAAHPSDRVYYYSDSTGSNQEKMLHELCGVLVIDASQFAEEAFLKRAAQSDPTLRLEQLHPGSRAFFQEARDEGLPEITALLATRGVPCRVVRFEPASLPALLIYPPAHDQIRKVREAVDQETVTGPLAEIMRDFLDHRAPAGADQDPVLHLNADSPLLAEIEERGRRSFLFEPAINLVQQFALFFAGKDRSAEECRSSFESAMESLATLLALGREDPCT